MFGIHIVKQINPIVIYQLGQNEDVNIWEESSLANQPQERMR